MPEESARPVATRPWTPEELESIADTAELRISTQRRSGQWRIEVPVWVVCLDGSVYVRTWHRRNTGWYGDAVRTRRARISVPGVSVEVTVQQLSAGPDGFSRSVDDAYRAKYGGGGDRSVGGMVTDEAVASTLELSPVSQRD
ncbi:DUF2255 family protein [Williamsia sterculiae]|uniref:DUF2255 family protein n=1 Tax=Williamsia sterculiae TaxID=1344003 RepID=A0A1N7D1A9_9NOCA|nr:DUF2255 family protein [Williamsia sterculiae]SIR69619.1 hypothetical protein SAMN05445060_0505 [Williamsia sterculiae]